MTSIRQNDAKAIRNIRKILEQGRSEPIDNPPSPLGFFRVNEELIDRLKSAFWLGTLLASCLLMLSGCSEVGFCYTDEQIVNAIYKAEGGLNARYPYGIRSVKCSGASECRRICERTVQNYRKKFQLSDNFRRNEDFIEYIGRHYCPTSGNLSISENRLNQYWLKNVTYFLSKENV